MNAEHAAAIPQAGSRVHEDGHRNSRHCDGVWLAPYVCVCGSPNGAIFLDLRRNRYLGIGLNETATLGHIVCDWSEWIRDDEHPRKAEENPDSMSIVQDLLDERLLVAAQPKVRIPPPHANVDGRLFSVGAELERDSPFNPAVMIRLVRAFQWARTRIRKGPLLPIVDELRRAKAGVSSTEGAPATDRFVELVCVFRRFRPYLFEARGQCLLHALALTRFLLLCGEPASWVIGVRTKPWGAHSWSQRGDLILDTTPERVVDYTPIMTI